MAFSFNPPDCKTGTVCWMLPKSAWKLSVTLAELSALWWWELRAWTALGTKLGDEALGAKLGDKALGTKPWGRSLGTKPWGRSLGTKPWGQSPRDEALGTKPLGRSLPFSSVSCKLHGEVCTLKRVNQKRGTGFVRDPVQSYELLSQSVVDMVNRHQTDGTFNGTF